MKRILSSLLVAGLLITAFTGARAQFHKNATLPAGKFTVIKRTNSQNSSHFSVRVDPRVMRNFIKTYPDVTDEKWFETANGFTVMFNLNNMDHQVAYDKKGDWLRTIRSYSENKLPQEVRHSLKSIYYDYDINLVQEVQRPEKPVNYIFHLIGKKEMINLGFCDGEIQVLEEFVKSE